MDFLIFATLLLFLMTIVIKTARPPSNFPKNIPTIPFYVAFVSTFTNWDQEEIFNRFYRVKLEKYGAVKVFFASRWNILVTRPEYVAQIFRQNDVFEKSGNHFKIPHAVSSEYMGDNVISAGNESWKLYRSVVTNGILFPDMEPLDRNVDYLIENLKKAALKSRAVPVSEKLQKFTLACIGDCMLSCDLRSTADGESIHQKVIYLKKQIFRPFYMTFPFLDKLPIPSRTRAREAVREFKRLFILLIQNGRLPENGNRLGPRLAESYEKGEITEKQFQDNAIIVMIAGHENPQMLLTSLLYVLGKHQSYQTRLREELASCSAGEQQENELLTSIIYETLRMYPPLAQLINRVTRKVACLGKDIVIPSGCMWGTIASSPNAIGVTGRMQTHSFPKDGEVLRKKFQEIIRWRKASALCHVFQVETERASERSLLWWKPRKQLSA